MPNQRTETQYRRYGGNVKLPSFRTLGIEENMDRGKNEGWKRGGRWKMEDGRCSGGGRSREKISESNRDRRTRTTS